MKILSTTALLATIFLVGCGSGSSRQLLSLTVTPASATAQAGQAQFMATGQFSQAPMNVTPAMAAWFQSNPPFDPPGDPIAFTLSSQPFTAKCLISGQTMNVIACSSGCKRQQQNNSLSGIPGSYGKTHNQPGG